MARSKLNEQREMFVIEEVRKIRDMFSILKRCFDALPDKSGINPAYVQFDGFDRNYESKYLAAAVQIRLERAYDSHAEMLPLYQLLMQRWEASDDMQNLTHSDLVRITSPATQNPTTRTP